MAHNQPDCRLAPVRARPGARGHLAAFMQPLGRSTIREVFLHLCTIRPLYVPPGHPGDVGVIRISRHLEPCCRIPAWIRPYAVDRRRFIPSGYHWRLGELEAPGKLVTGLSRVCAGGGQGACCRVVRPPRRIHRQPKICLPQLTRELRTWSDHACQGSVTIGVNLDGQLRPVAHITDSEDRKFSALRFFDRLFGRHGRGFESLGPLHMVPDWSQAWAIRQRKEPGRQPLMVPLPRVAHPGTVCQPIARALRQ